MNQLTKYSLPGVLLVTICLGALAFYYHGKYKVAESEISSTQAVTNNVLTTISLMQYISRAAHDDKDKIALESQRAKADIKTATAGDVCADSLVPTSAVNRLREYAESVRSGSNSTNPQRAHR